MLNSPEPPVAGPAVGGPDDDAWVREIGAVAWAALADQLNVELFTAQSELDQERARSRDLEIRTAALIAENAALAARAMALSIESAGSAAEKAELTTEKASLAAEKAELIEENAALTTQNAAEKAELVIEKAALVAEKTALTAERVALRSRVLPVTDVSGVDSDRELLAMVRQARVDQVAAQTRLACAGAELVARACAREEAAAYADQDGMQGRRQVGIARVDVAQRRAVMQIALASGLSEYSVRRLTDLAHELPTRLPQVWAALVGPDSVGLDSGGPDSAGTESNHAADAVADAGVGPVFDWDKAQAIFSHTLPLAEDVAQRVANRVLARAPRLVTAAKVRAFAEDAAAKADPVMHREVVAEAYAARTVSFRSAGAGMGAMTLTTDAVTIETVKAALVALAKQADANVYATPPAAEDEAGRGRMLVTRDLRGVGARRADTLSDVIIHAAGALDATCGPGITAGGDAADAGVAVGSGVAGQLIAPSLLDLPRQERPLPKQAPPEQAPPELPALPPAPGQVRSRMRARIQVLVPLSTLLGDEAPAELLGYGPIPAELARRIVADQAEHASWQCVYTDDRVTTDTDTDDHEWIIGIGKSFHTNSYQPSPLLRAFLEVRDRTCVAPGCRQPAHRCDLDHAERFADGGTTCDCNLQTLCRHHHRIKHYRSGLPTIELPVESQASPSSH